MSCLRAEEREGDLKGKCYSCLRVSIHYQYKILLSSCVITIYNSNIVDRDTKWCQAVVWACELVNA